MLVISKSLILLVSHVKLSFVANNLTIFTTQTSARKPLSKSRSNYLPLASVLPAGVIREASINPFAFNIHNHYAPFWSSIFHNTSPSVASRRRRTSGRSCHRDAPFPSGGESSFSLTMAMMTAPLKASIVQQNQSPTAASAYLDKPKPSAHPSAMDLDNEERDGASRSTVAHCLACKASFGEFFNSWRKVTGSYYLPSLAGSYSITGLHAKGKPKPASQESQLHGW
jgi:hypothetical protein